MSRRFPWILVLVLAALLFGALKPGLFPWQRWLGSVTPLETPRKQLLRQWKTVGFDTTGIGKRWLAARPKAIDALGDVPIQLPQKQRLYFTHEPRAHVLRLEVQAGRVLVLSLRDSLSESRAIVEILSDDDDLRVLEARPTDSDSLRLSFATTTTLLLSIEALPWAIGAVDLTLHTEPQLPEFPVEGAVRRDIGSVWGDPRDGGRRRHEGIDIFAARGTPLLAASDGRVTRVREGGLGGKQVWLEVPDVGRLYYAHLDEQLVSTGDRVRAGEVVGTVGNTGNARTTPPHLHFGIYGHAGAVDPLPFVDPARLPGQAALRNSIGREARLRRSLEGYSAGEYVRVIGVAGEELQVEFLDGKQLQVPTTSLRRLRSSGARVRRSTASRDLLTPRATGWYATGRVLSGERYTHLADTELAPYQYVETEGGSRGWLRQGSAN